MRLRGPIAVASVMIAAITAVVRAVRADAPLPPCEDVFPSDLVECLA